MPELVILLRLGCSAVRLRNIYIALFCNRISVKKNNNANNGVPILTLANVCFICIILSVSPHCRSLSDWGRPCRSVSATPWGPGVLSPPSPPPGSASSSAVSGPPPQPRVTSALTRERHHGKWVVFMQFLKQLLDIKVLKSISIKCYLFSTLMPHKEKISHGTRSSHSCNTRGWYHYAGSMSFILTTSVVLALPRSILADGTYW